MTGPQPQQDPMLRLQYYKETNQPELAQKYEQYLRETGQFPSQDGGPGALSRGVSALAGGVLHAVMHPIDTAESLVTAPVKSAMTALAPSANELAEEQRPGSISRGALLARGGVTPPWQLSQPNHAVTGGERAAATAQTVANMVAPGAFKAAERVATPFLGSALARGTALATTGAGTGAAYSPQDPAAGAVAGAIAAPVLGGATSFAAKALPYGKAAYFARKTGEPNDLIAEGERAASVASKPLYDQFRALGNLPLTPKLKEMIGDPASGDNGLPIVRRAISTVKGENPDLRKLPDTDAEVLDAVYKQVGNKAWTAQMGYNAGVATDALRDALDEAAQTKGGSYSAATSVHHEGMQIPEAIEKGRATLQQALSPAGGLTEGAKETTPKAFTNQYRNAPDAERQAALKGLYGQANRLGLMDLKNIAGTPIRPAASQALRKAVSIQELLKPTVNPFGAAVPGIPIATGAGLSNSSSTNP